MRIYYLRIGMKESLKYSEDEAAFMEMLAEGEHQQQDFKYNISDTRRIARSLSAFANTDGGRLLIGIKDNGKITGISDDEEFYMIQSAAELYCVPAIEFDSQVWRVKDKDVLEIKVQPSEQRPHSVKDEDGKLFPYLRLDDHNYKANDVIITAWKMQRKEIDSSLEMSQAERSLLSFMRERESFSFMQAVKATGIDSQRMVHLLALLLRWQIMGYDIIDGKYIYALSDQDQLGRVSIN